MKLLKLREKWVTLVLHIRKITDNLNLCNMLFIPSKGLMDVWDPNSDIF